jgi:hypothetical protein
MDLTLKSSQKKFDFAIRHRKQEARKKMFHWNLVEIIHHYGIVFGQLVSAEFFVQQLQRALHSEQPVVAGPMFRWTQLYSCPAPGLVLSLSKRQNSLADKENEFIQVLVFIAIAKKHLQKLLTYSFSFT